MEHVSRSAAPSRDDTLNTRGIRTNTHSNGNLGAYQYDTGTAVYGDGPAQFQTLVTRRHSDEQSSDRYNKKPRLNGSHSGATSSSENCEVRPGAASSHSLSVRLGREHVVRATAVPPRYTDATAGVPSFLASILDTTHAYDSSLDGVPATWGPYGRSSRTSPPVMSPVTSGSFSRRDSGNSAASPAVPSSAPSPGNTSRDGNASSRRASEKSRSSPSYTFTAPVSPQRTSDDGSPNNTGTSMNFHTALPPVSNPVLVPPIKSPIVYSQPTPYYGVSAGNQNQPSSLPYSNDAYYSNSTNQAALYSDTARSGPATFVAPFRPGRQELEYPGFVQSQAQEYDAELVGEGEWTRFLAAAEAGTFAESLPRRATVQPSPAALHNIINPVDDDPPFRVTASMHRDIQSNGRQGPISNDVSAAQNFQLVQTDKAGRRPRSTFSFEKRQETSQTRTIGACLRCKSQRVRCIPSPEGPNGVCLTCEHVSQNSKKVLHDIHCVRWRLNEMSLYRHGGLNLTKRWSGTVIKDIANWNGDDIHEIEMKIFYSSAMHKYDLCPVPVKLRVRRFTPEAHDVLVRKWSKPHVDENGATTMKKVYVELPPYALLDANEAASTLRDYFLQNTMHAMANVARSSIPVVRHHMEALIRHYYSLADGDVEKTFLERFFRMWFCIRFTTGSSYISGPNKLGCHPVEDPHYPLGSRISVPRMVTAQCDSIMVTRFLRPLASEVLNEFERFFRVGNPDHWFMLYACTFMLLHEVSFSSQDRHRHAMENWITDARYSVSDFVKDLQFSANIILCYWHYYRTMDPTDDGWDIFCQIIKPNPQPRENIESAKGKGKKKVHVTQEQCDLLMDHWHDMLNMAKKTKTPKMYLKFEHPLYFVSQMYIKGWKVLETYDNRK